MPGERLGLTASEAHEAQPMLRLWGRALRLRCTACGGAPIFRGWFAMHENCRACGRRFNRDAGYLLGSIYFNYGLTGSLLLAMYFVMFFWEVLSNQQRLLVLGLFAVLFPMWFFRYARAFWMAFDERWDPWPNSEEKREMRRQATRADDIHTPADRANSNETNHGSH